MVHPAKAHLALFPACQVKHTSGYQSGGLLSCPAGKGEAVATPSSLPRGVDSPHLPTRPFWASGVSVQSNSDEELSVLNYAGRG